MKLLFAARPSQMGLTVILSCISVAAAVTASAQQGEMTTDPAQGAQHALYQTGQQMPPYPASPLAGGAAAANGGQFMDASGNPIVMPAQYMEACPPGMYPDAGGYGDPMAVDFGGYGQDQVGPHYFDVSFGTVFLQGEDLFEGLEPFASAGVGSPDFFLDPDQDYDDHEAGWEIAARYDIGALAVLEASYMGIYDIGFSDSVLSTQVAPGGAPFSLVSVFNDYGVGAPIEGIDQGSSYTLAYEADLQSTEFNYRRYWVGYNPRISGTWLVGAHYLRFTDQLQFDSTALVTPTIETASLQWSGENDLVGAQFGGDAWLGLRQGLRVGVTGTAGVYNNRFKFNNSGVFSAAGAPADFVNSAEGNQVAFASKADVSFVADILPSWSLKGGYRLLYLNSLVTGANNVNQADITSSLISTQGDILFHGFHGGLEYVW